MPSTLAQAGLGLTRLEVLVVLSRSIVGADEGAQRRRIHEHDAREVDLDPLSSAVEQLVELLLQERPRSRCRARR